MNLAAEAPRHREVIHEDLVEVKSVERMDPVFDAQILTYLRITGKHTGLLIDFNSRLLKDRVKRYAL